MALGCEKPTRAPTAEVTGTLRVSGAPVALVGCRPGHAVHVFVEVDTARGALRFGEGKLYWQGSEQTCPTLDRRWGGGVREDGSAYFRGTLAFHCDPLPGARARTAGDAGELIGDLALDCGQITPGEAGELARNRTDTIRPR